MQRGLKFSRGKRFALADGNKVGQGCEIHLCTGDITRSDADVVVTAAGAALSLRDVWARRELGTFTASYSARVPGHGARVLMLPTARSPSS